MARKDNMNKKINNVQMIIIVVSLVLVTICLGFSFFFYFNPSEIKIESEKAAEGYINKVNSLMFGSADKEKLKKILKFDINSDFVMFGIDSYQREKPSSEIIKKYKLEEYEKLGDKLSDNLEKKMKNNFESEITKVSLKKKYYIVNVTYKSFYYYAYLCDLKSMETELLAVTGIISGDGVNNVDDAYLANQYKAKVKAMQILDKHLDSYVNKDEKGSFEVFLKNGLSSQSKKEVEAYLYNLVGYSYNKLKVNDSNRINGYVNEIKKDKTLDL